MGKIKALIGGLGAGALAMYFYDPQKGRRRRNEVRDKFNAVLNAKLEAKEVMLRDASNRVRGIAATARARFKKTSPEDSQLVARIRSEMGHIISHPGPIEVQASKGRVRLNGPILAAEVDDLIGCVWQIPGVESIEHQLQVHETAEGISALQGSCERPDQRPDLFRENWAPATSLAVGIAGGMLAVYGLARRGVVGTTLGAVGMGLLAKSLRDTEGKIIAN